MRYGLLPGALLLLLAACGGGQPGVPPGPTLAPLEQPSKRCGFPSARAEVLRFRTVDGVTLDGAVVGTGSIGVVLAHQYPASLCGWWPYATYLAKRGFQVMLFDFRCFGESACPTEHKRWDLTADLQAASSELLHRGTDSVSLVGASLGAAAVLVAGTKLSPRPSSVISLSGEPDLGNIGLTDNAGPAVHHLDVPTLYVVARDDPSVSVEETRTMFRNTASNDKQLIVLPAYDGHGWDMLTKSLTTWGPLAARAAEFIREHAAT
jgi:pimeloyl-ACP methyl ester carboxylesterase